MVRAEVVESARPTGLEKMAVRTVELEYFAEV